MTDNTQRVYGGVKVDLGGGTIGNVASQEASLAKIMAIAAEIWTKIRQSGISADDNIGNDRLLNELQKEYQEFAISYPIPFRWMIQIREYEPRAFEIFLRKHVKVMYEDRKKFLAAQGEYLVLLYKIRNPRVGARQITRYREEIQQYLEEDDKTFTKAREEAEIEVKRMDKENDIDRRRRIMQYLCRLKAERAAASTTVPVVEENNSSDT